MGVGFGRVRVCGCAVGCGWVGLRSAGKRYTDCCVFCASVDHCAAMRCARTAVSLCLSLSLSLSLSAPLTPAPTCYPAQTELIKFCALAVAEF